MRKIIFKVFFLMGVLSGVLWAEEVKLTLLQTGDLHGHFLPSRVGPYSLGGYARLKSYIDKTRKEDSNVLYLDSGDFSEGTIFYNVDRARPMLMMLEELGLEAAVLGNHDWIRGPAFLEEWLSNGQHSFPVLSANLMYTNETKSLNKLIPTYAEYLKDSKQPPPWIILEKKGLKIGIFGLSTDELFYQYLFDPVRIGNPFAIAQGVISQLRSQVDIVIALTHQTDEADENLAKHVDGIDFILGGHSHVKFPEAKVIEKVTVVERIRNIKSRLSDPKLSPEKKISLKTALRAAQIEKEQSKTYIMKTGQFGQYIGRLDISFKTDTKELELMSSKLVPMDATISEDTDMSKKVREYVNQLEEEYGNIFSDHIASSNVDFPKMEFCESRLGNLVADIVYDKAKEKDDSIQFAVDNPSFLSAGLSAGFIDSAAVYDLMSHIYNHDDKSNWHLYAIDMLGKDITAALGLIFAYGKFINVSHAEVVYTNAFLRRKFKIYLNNGELMDANKTYRFVGGGGLVDALYQIQSLGLIPQFNFKEVDLGLTYWKVLRDGLKDKSVLTLENTTIEGRVRSHHPDVAVYPEDISIKAVDEKTLELEALVYNLGETATDNGTEVTFYYDTTPHRLDDNPDYPQAMRPEALESPHSFKPLASVTLGGIPERSKQKVSLQWSFPMDIQNTNDVRYLPILVQIAPLDKKNDNAANNMAIVYYEMK